jgi:hypothetical protein
MSVDQNPLDPQTEYIIEEARPGEPDHLTCAHCDVSIKLTEIPTASVFRLDHPDWCPNAGVTPPDPEIPDRLQ